GVADRDVIRAAADGEAPVVLKVSIAEEHLRALPVAHRRVVCHDRGGAGSGIEHHALERIGEKRRLFRTLSKRAHRRQHHERREQRDRCRPTSPELQLAQHAAPPQLVGATLAPDYPWWISWRRSVAE